MPSPPARPLANRATALLSGVALGAGVRLLPWLQESMALSDRAHGVGVMVVILGLFFVPVMLCVVGLPHLTIPSAPEHRAAHRASLRQVALRGLFWALGCGIAVANPAGGLLPP